MAFTTINKGASYFNTILYTGNGSARSLTGVNFKPDFVWIKSRSSGTWWHQWQDIVRGATKRLASNDTATEATDVQTLTSFDTDGFSLGTSTSYNNNADTYVAWNWLAANSTTTNTSGTITSTVSANTTAGFSVVGYTGTGANATVGHGLGVAPSMYIIKSRTGTAEPWFVYHKSIGNTGGILLNSTNAQVTSSTWFNNTSPTSSVFSIGSNSGVSGTGNTHIAYCFAEVKGYSKFGSYTGNGSSDGTFVYTGFKPAFVMYKNITSAGTSWVIYDSKRDTYNATSKRLLPNSSAAEDSVVYIDLLSNGFKCRDTNIGQNESGSTMIYAAFAENPFVLTDGTPVTAR
jgi:hypothetical protein